LWIVVTAGPTREFLDSIRFISNPSSGKMGYAIAQAAAEAGHAVTLVSGPVALTPPAGVRVAQVTTTAEMAAATKKAFRDADAAVLVAAVCDYRPKHRAARKIAKVGRERTLVLAPTEDIAAAVGRVKGRRVTIGFALEDHGGRRNAERKLTRKNFDAILLNGPENVGADACRFEYLTVDEPWRRWPRASKRETARRLIRELERLVRRTEKASGESKS